MDDGQINDEFAQVVVARHGVKRTGHAAVA
jgi:hypothetical protein